MRRWLGIGVMTASTGIAVAGSARAQDLPSDPTVPTLTVEIEESKPVVPPGIQLSVVAQTPGVPAVLETVEGRADAVVATVRVRNVGDVPLTALLLAVTVIRNGEDLAVRRTLPLVVTLAPDAIDTIDVAGASVIDLAPARPPGEPSLIEAAIVGATTTTGETWEGDLDVPWAAQTKGQTAVACADAAWQAVLPESTTTDPVSGATVRCDRLGRWRPVVAEEVQ